MNRNYRPTRQGWAIILLSAAVLALGGCGRKGGLDLPPNTPPQAAAAAQRDADHEPAASAPSVFNSDLRQRCAARRRPKAARRPFILDPLLDSH